MARGDKRMDTYMDALKEANEAGKDAQAAAEYAERATMDKHGAMPKREERHR